MYRDLLHSFALVDNFSAFSCTLLPLRVFFNKVSGDGEKFSFFGSKTRQLFDFSIKTGKRMTGTG
jgi:hypothetical protein